LTANGQAVTPKWVRVQRRGIGSHRIYRATISSLRPGAPVRYEVLEDNRTVFRSRVAAPKGSRQPFRMVVVGDIGRGTRGQKLVASQMAKANPDLVVVPGDIVYPHGRMQEYRKFFFPVYEGLLARSLWVGVTGNHDTLYRDLRRYPDGLAYYDYWYQPTNGPSGPGEGQSANFSFVYGDTHWTVLDSNPYFRWTQPRNQAWLEQAVRTGSRYRWNLVTFHQPPYHSSDKKKDEVYMRAVADIFTRHKVDVVFNGHVHNYQRTWPMRTSARGQQWQLDRVWNGVDRTRANGTIYVVTGAGGAELYDQRLARTRERWKPFTAQYLGGHSFTLVDASWDRLAFQQIGTDGRILDRFTITK
jgi:predicted phosphodiesterase